MTGTLVFDLDGVVYVGNQEIAGAGDALATVASSGYSVVFATNAAIRSPASVAMQIRSVTGYPAESDQIVTSAVAAASVIGPDRPVLAVGEEGLWETLATAGIGLTDEPGEARSVVVGLDRGFTYERLQLASDAVRNGARLIATNTDATFPTTEGPAPGAGSLVAAVEAASGATAEVTGKPNGPMVRAVSRLLAPGPVWVVGDRAETDLALAAAAGWGRILVLSGITTDPEEVPAEFEPDMTIPSIAALPEALKGLVGA